jgi:hypothetical protein
LHRSVRDVRPYGFPHENDALNLIYLGEGLDHWKGSLFESLQQEKAVQGLAVDPMTSDLSEKVSPLSPTR